jgi:hypothetical protein
MNASTPILPVEEKIPLFKALRYLKIESCGKHGIQEYLSVKPHRRMLCSTPLDGPEYVYLVLFCFALVSFCAGGLGYLCSGLDPRGWFLCLVPLAMIVLYVVIIIVCIFFIDQPSGSEKSEMKEQTFESWLFEWVMMPASGFWLAEIISERCGPQPEIKEVLISDPKFPVPDSRINRIVEELRWYTREIDSYLNPSYEIIERRDRDKVVDRILVIHAGIREVYYCPPPEGSRK